MVIVLDDKKEDLLDVEQPDNVGPSVPTVAGPSTVAPSATTFNSPPLPTFEEANEAASLIRHDFADSDVFVPPGGEEPPPDFTPYEAEFFETSDGNVISHDPHLNEDGAPQFNCFPCVSIQLRISCRRSTVPLPPLSICQAPNIQDSSPRDPYRKQDSPSV